MLIPFSRHCHKMTLGVLCTDKLSAFSNRIYSCILTTDSLLCPYIVGALSVINPKRFSQGSPSHFHIWTTFHIHLEVVQCIRCNVKNLSVLLRLKSILQMKIDSWAISDVSVLSSTREYGMKSSPFPTSYSFRLVESWYTHSAWCFCSSSRLTMVAFCQGIFCHKL